MKTITTTYYEYNELSDEMKDKAIELYRYGFEYPMYDEAMQSLEAFLSYYSAELGAHTIDLEAGASGINIEVPTEYDLTVDEAAKLNKRLENEEDILTGYFLDNSLFGGMRNAITNNEKDESGNYRYSVLDMLNKAVNKWHEDMQNDYEHMTSDAGMVENIEANDYLFDGTTGALAPLEAYEKQIATNI